jgi:hypothetical protein
MNTPIQIQKIGLSLPLPPPRRGWLRHGNPPGDYAKAPRCGAHTRASGRCRQPAMKNGRCRMHGGLSTGPRTAEGLARARRARWKHGFDSAETRALRRAVVQTCRALAAVTQLARAELRRRRGIHGRPADARPAGRSASSGASAASSLGMGSIEQILLSAGSSSGAPDRRARLEGFVGASCTRPSPARCMTGDRRSPLRGTDVEDLHSGTSSLGMGSIARISTLPSAPLDDLEKDSPQSHEGHERPVGASGARPANIAPLHQGDRRSPLRGTGVVQSFLAWYGVDRTDSITARRR